MGNPNSIDNLDTCCVRSGYHYTRCFRYRSRNLHVGYIYQQYKKLHLYILFGTALHHTVCFLDIRWNLHKTHQKRMMKIWMKKNLKATINSVR